MFIAWRKFKYRLRCPHKKPRQPAAHRLLALLFVPAVIFSASFLTFCKIEKRIGPVAQQAAMSRLTSVVTTSVNESVNDILLKENIDARSLIIAERNEDGSINSVSADHNNVNKLKSNLALDVQNRIDNIESVDIRIPAGLLFSDSALTGAGIKLRLKVFAISSAVIEFKDEFSSAGINQTKYSLSANIRIPVKIAGIGSSVDSEIVTAVPIAETIIVGNIPHAYLDTSNK